MYPPASKGVSRLWVQWTKSVDLYNRALLPLILTHFFSSLAASEDSWVSICLVLWYFGERCGRRELELKLIGFLLCTPWVLSMCAVTFAVPKEMGRVVGGMTMRSDDPGNRIVRNLPNSVSRAKRCDFIYSVGFGCARYHPSILLKLLTGLSGDSGLIFTFLNQRVLCWPTISSGPVPQK